MTSFDELEPKEREAIVALPYQAGMWVSHSDDVDGEEDDKAEIRALVSSIRQIPTLHEGSALVQMVGKEILESREKWPQWEDSSFHIGKTAPATLQNVVRIFGRNEAKAYRAAIMTIAKTVAQAAGEFAAFDSMDQEEEEGFFSNMVGKIMGGFSKMSDEHDDHPANISPAEDSAISQLAAALTLPE